MFFDISKRITCQSYHVKCLKKINTLSIIIIFNFFTDKLIQIKAGGSILNIIPMIPLNLFLVAPSLASVSTYSFSLQRKNTFTDQYRVREVFNQSECLLEDNTGNCSQSNSWLQNSIAYPSNQKAAFGKGKFYT